MPDDEIVLTKAQVEIIRAFKLAAYAQIPNWNGEPPVAIWLGEPDERTSPAFPARTTDVQILPASAHADPIMGADVHRGRSGLPAALASPMGL